MAGSALKTFDSALPIWERDFLNGNGVSCGRKDFHSGIHSKVVSDDLGGDAAPQIARVYS